MAHPSFEDVRRLAEWRPALGVVSVYLRFEPGDRGRAWQTELRNALAAILEREDELDHATRKALRATTKRIAERLANHERDLPRGEAGFVEVAAGDGDERWWPTHVAPPAAGAARFTERPVVAPLLGMVEAGAPRGVALLSSERVRLLEWAPGSIEDLHAWELVVFAGDWRERKSTRVVDPARSQAVTASGRDQFDERLTDNRERFLGECGRLAAGIGAKRHWPRLVAFGAPEHVRDFRAGTNSASPPVDSGDEADLISTPDGELEARVGEAVARLAGERQRAMAERTLEEARGGVRGTLGRQETRVALEEGRVDLLLLDAALASAACSTPPGPAGPDGEGTEDLVGLALAGGSRIAVVAGDAAEPLAAVDGVAALLRY